MVYVFPTLFTLVLLLAQATVWWHAVHVAQVTAADALATTRVQGGTPSAGRDEVQRVLDQIGHGPLHGVSVSVTRGPDRAEVHIDATASAVVPFVHLPIHVHAAGPVERFRPATGAAS
jgi:hypothetical protein